MSNLCTAFLKNIFFSVKDFKPHSRYVLKLMQICTRGVCYCSILTITEMLIFPKQISWKSFQQLSRCYMWTNRHSTANKHTF